MVNVHNNLILYYNEFRIIFIYLLNIYIILSYIFALYEDIN